MAKVTPIDKLPRLDKHQLQQVLLQRDESVERLAKIGELEEELKQVKAESEQQILALTKSNDVLYANLIAIRSVFSEVEGTPEFIEKKRLVQEAKQKLRELDDLHGR